MNPPSQETTEVSITPTSSKIVLPTLINHSMGKTAIICQFHHLSMTSTINRIIKYTFDHIRFLVPPESQFMYLEVEQLLKDVDTSGFQQNEIDRVNWTPLTTPFQNIIEFSKFILENLGPSLTQGSGSFPAFCFNAWDIFEKFIRRVLQIHIKDNLQILKKPLKLRNRKIEPDILGYDSACGQYLLVGDVKYKIQYEHSDYDQISTYLRELDLEIGVLIYPVQLTVEIFPDYKFVFFDFEKWSNEKEDYLHDFSNEIVKWKNNIFS